LEEQTAAAQVEEIAIGWGGEEEDGCESEHGAQVAADGRHVWSSR
jgi:hypothetical protein